MSAPHEPPAKRQKAADDLVVDAEEAVSFHGLSSTSREALLAEIEAGGTEFQGEFFHQHFGEEEKIKGYEGLRVRIWFSLRTYHAWLDVSWTKRKPGADKVVPILQEHFPHASATKDSFVDAIASDLKAHPDIVAAGDVLCTLDTSPNELGEVVFVKYHLASSGHVREMHERLDALLLFFVDGASLIDTQDPKWELMLAVQRQSDGTGSLVAGMQTLYNFWAYPSRRTSSASERSRPQTPDKRPAEDDTAGVTTASDDISKFMRLRLSQVLVVPPFQGLGLGKRFLQLAYEQAVARGCLDLTIEDPSENFQRVREKLEVEMLLGTPWANELIDASVAAASAAADSTAAALAVAPQQQLLARAVADLKIPRRQARIVWEALLLLAESHNGNEGIRAPVEQLVRLRLDEFNFGRGYAETVRKEVITVAIPDSSSGNKSKNVDKPFVMMRCKHPKGDAAAPGTSAPGNAEVENMAATGRLNVVMVSAEKKEEQLQQLVEERMDQLDTLARLLKARHGNAKSASRAGVPAESRKTGSTDGSARQTHVTAEAV